MTTAYTPCGSTTSKEETYYQQQIRYIDTKGPKTTPKEMFRKDLLRQLQKQRSKEDRIVLMMDVNEDMLEGMMRRQIRHKDTGMREVVHSFAGSEGPKTYFKD